MTDVISVLEKYGLLGVAAILWTWFIAHSVFSTSDTQSFDRIKRWVAENTFGEKYYDILDYMLGKFDALVDRRSVPDEESPSISQQRVFKYFGKNPWSASSFDFCLAMSLIYPIAAALVFWVMSGRELVIKADGISVADDGGNIFLRLLIAPFLILLYYIPWKIMYRGFVPRIDVSDAPKIALGGFLLLFVLYFTYVLYNFGFDRQIFMAAVEEWPFFLIYLVKLSALLIFAPLPYLSLRYALKGEGVRVLCVGVVGLIFLLIGTITPVRQGKDLSVGGYIIDNLETLIVITTMAVVFLTVTALIKKSISEKSSWQISFAGWVSAVLIVILALSLLPVYENREHLSYTELYFIKLFIMFWLFMPIVNAPVDWLSLGLTRGLLHAINTRTHRSGIVLLWAALDLVLALVLLMAVTSATVLAVGIVNYFTQTFASYTFINLDEIVAIITADSYEPALLWIYFSFFSTLIPTMIHAFVAWLAIIDYFGRVPMVRKWRRVAPLGLGADVQQRWLVTCYLSVMPLFSLGLSILSVYIIFSLLKNTVFHELFFQWIFFLIRLVS